ncbi:DUF6888 family protein [Nostoc sp.]|uniref:DUF6888 family protein n=1 Tax=Nostoc sp. TaxID=1180 RepID=UPI003FA5BC67
MEPSSEQLKQCYRISCELTKMLVSIDLIAFDIRTKEVYIIAGDEFEILIDRNGKVRYL